MRMRIARPTLPFVLVTVLCAGAVALPAAQSDGVAVAFSDPSRVGSVSVRVHDGAIVIKGENRKDVLVTARSREQRTRANPPAGFRVLSSGGGVTITEENNEIQIGATTTRRTDVEIRVPARVNLRVSGHNGAGEGLEVEGVEGDIEARHHNGSIRLSNVGGSVVANTHNGDIRVTLARITVEKAMAFTSFNGTLDVTLPTTAKANLKMRSDKGDIFTDFDMQLRPSATPQARRDGKTTTIEVNQSVYGAINGGGPEFELRTYNGNIYVRKASQ